MHKRKYLQDQDQSSNERLKRQKETKQEIKLFSKLPMDLLMHITNFLQPSQVASLSLTNKENFKIFNLSVKNPSVYLKQLSSLVTKRHYPESFHWQDTLTLSKSIQDFLNCSSTVLKRVNLFHVFVSWKALLARCGSKTKHLALGNLYGSLPLMEEQMIMNCLAKCNKLKILELIGMSESMMFLFLKAVSYKHLHALHIQTHQFIRMSEIEPCLLDLVQKAPIKYLSFQGHLPNETTFRKMLETAPHLQTLVIQDVTNHKLCMSFPEAPTQLLKLSRLSLKNSMVSHEFSLLPQRLSQCLPNLTELNLESTLGMTHKQLIYMMQNCKKLTTLCLPNFLSNVSFDSASQTKLFQSEPMTWIKHLDIRGWKKLSTESLVMILRCCPELESINISNCTRIKTSAIYEAMRHRRLQSLILSHELMSQSSCLCAHLLDLPHLECPDCKEIPSRWKTTKLPRITVQEDVLAFKEKYLDGDADESDTSTSSSGSSSGESSSSDSEDEDEDDEMDDAIGL